MPFSVPAIYRAHQEPILSCKRLHQTRDNVKLLFYKIPLTRLDDQGLIPARMVANRTLQPYILLPALGLRLDRRVESRAVCRLFQTIGTRGVQRLSGFCILPDAPDVRMRVLDAIHPEGATLVEMSAAAAVSLRARHPGIRIEPIRYFRTAVTTRPAIAKRPDTARRITLTVVSKSDGRPVGGATVVAFTDFAGHVGAQGKTNTKGDVRLALGSGRKLDRLYVYPPRGFWGALRRNLTVSSEMAVDLDPVDLSFTDALRYFYGQAGDGAGRGVKVGVIDTGIALDHPDLKVSGGENCVVGENPEDFGDNGEGHGTHVAGIIAARGRPPGGIRGIAPGAVIRSYRVFGKNAEGATNYAIAKAIDRAAADGCDLINMSLGGGEPDAATRSAIEEARSKGVLPIVAAGNEYRSPVSFPASESPAIAVSAMGRKGTFPSGSTETGDIAAPYGSDKNNFIAAFSNVGPEIDLTAPGVGVLSTVPGGYAPMSGTSMACPAATGDAAKILSGLGLILRMKRNAERSGAMAKALFGAARSLGFEPRFEGQGILR